MSAKSIHDNLIDYVVMYQEKYWLQRWDIWPFLLIYLIGFACVHFGNEIENNVDLTAVGLVIIPVGLIVHIGLFLAAQASVAFRCWIGKNKVDDINRTSFIYVRAMKNAGKDKLVPLYHSSLTTITSGVANIKVFKQNFALSNEFFKYQEVVYYYSSQQQTFVRLDYPSSTKLSDLMNWHGFHDLPTVSLALRRWGLNEFNIPLPNFLDLYMV